MGAKPLHPNAINTTALIFMSDGSPLHTCLAYLSDAPLFPSIWGSSTTQNVVIPHATIREI